MSLEHMLHAGVGTELIKQSSNQWMSTLLYETWIYISEFCKAPIFYLKATLPAALYVNIAAIGSVQDLTCEQIQVNYEAALL